MSFFSGKKLLLVGFIVVLLIAIPVTVYLVGQQQKTKSSAAEATTMALVQSPQTVKVGDTVSFDVVVDPANINEIGYVKLVFSYDPTKLATFDGTFTPNQWTSSSGVTFTPDLTNGPPEYGDGTISVDMSVGGSFQNVFKAKTTVATIKFKALDTTEPDIATDITFGTQTQARSTADEGNVLSSLPPPGKVFITNGTTETPTDTPTPTTVIADTPTDTPTPTDIAGATDTPTLTDTPTPTGFSPLTCTSLALDPGASGTIPFALNLTATGTSSAANITKVTFNYGDGQTQDVTDAGGVGTTSISVLASHTYAASGTFKATAVLTDENGAVSSGGCIATITVADQAGASPTVVSPSPLPPTGPTGLVTIGAIGVMLTFIGAILLLAL